jgi:hypothetical protein
MAKKNKTTTKVITTLHLAKTKQKKKRLCETSFPDLDYLLLSDTFFATFLFNKQDMSGL